MTDKYKNINFIEHFQHGIVIFDDALRLSAYNQKALALVGLTEESVKLGTPFMEYAYYFTALTEYPDQEELLKSHIEFIENRQDFTIDQVMPNGVVLYRHCEFMKDGGLVMTITDVSDLSNAQDKLKTANSALEEANHKQNLLYPKYACYSLPRNQLNDLH